MLIWVALMAAAALMALSVRSMAYAFARTVDTRSRALGRGGVRAEREVERLTRREVAMLLTEIAMSVGIALTIVGLTIAAALPGRLLIGALLAQAAVLGAIVAPPVAHEVVGTRMRPAAIALGVAQLAQVAFFLRAIEALL